MPAVPPPTHLLGRRQLTISMTIAVALIVALSLAVTLAVADGGSAPDSVIVGPFRWVPLMTHA